MLNSPHIGRQAGQRVRPGQALAAGAAGGAPGADRWVRLGARGMSTPLPCQPWALAAGARHEKCCAAPRPAQRRFFRVKMRLH